MKNFILGLDVDGTLFEHEYPDLGPMVEGAYEWLVKFQELGIKFVLFTMRDRDTEDGDMIQPVLYELASYGIEDIYGVNENPTQKSWTRSPKAYCNYYLDDAAIGVPLIYPKSGKRPYIDWEKAGPMVIEKFEEYCKKYEQV